MSEVNIDEVPPYLRRLLPQSSEPTSEPEKPMNSQTAHFKAYQEAEDLLAEAEEALEFCKAEVCEKAKAIFETYGPGPFEWQGRHLRFVQRKGKSGGGDTYYARKVNPAED